MSVALAKAKSILGGPHMLPLSFRRDSYEPVLRAIGDAEVVLIGDGSHGTYDFYAHRANITQRLVEEKGFTAIAVEADWPDAWRVNRYIHGLGVRDGEIRSARDARRDFERFPKWMWKNEVMLPFISHLRMHNAGVTDPSAKVSFFGMDLYSLHRSAEAVVDYLLKIDPDAAKEAKKKYNCFERFWEDTTRYAIGEPVWDDEVNLNGDLRDDHFARVLIHIRKYLGKRDANGDAQPAKIVVWAHYSHIGDARYTDMGWKRGQVVSAFFSFRYWNLVRAGEINVGQRCRELFGEENVYNIGFLTVQWDDTPRLHAVNPPFQRSIEKIFDDVSTADFYIVMQEIEKETNGENRKRTVDVELARFLDEPRYQRFIGVIYRPATELLSHYSQCKMSKQYDAIALVKHARGIRPLEPEDTWKGPKAEADLTFPFGY